MDLADFFLRLRELNLDETAVTGDIRRDIRENDFPALVEALDLPKSVYGGCGYEFQRISDAPELIRTLYVFKKQQRPTLKMGKFQGWQTSKIGDDWYGKLSEDSPDCGIGMDYLKVMMLRHHSAFTLLKRDLALDIDGKLIMAIRAK